MLNCPTIHLDAEMFWYPELISIAKDVAIDAIVVIQAMRPPALCCRQLTC